MTILQPGAGPIRASTYLPADPAQVLWGRLPCAADRAVLEVDPGAEVTIDTLSHEGLLDDQGSDPREFFGRFGVDDVLEDAVALAATRTRDPERDGPHVITGPVGIRGARAGDVLSVRIVELLPRVPYGVISNRHGRGALPGEYPRAGETVSIFARADGGDGVISRGAGSAETVRFPLAPFLGTIGVAAPGDVRPHSVPPDRFGGNIDIRLLTAGATLHLPVLVDGALAYVGDPHFAQGDGEVALTAFEASLRATVRFDVVPAADPFARFVQDFGPVAETDELICPTGLDPDLREAMKKSVRASIAYLRELHGFDDEHAYAYLSAATDFRISQVVDRTTGIHAAIRKADLA
jgi:acetamidase/formamidase